MKKQVTAHHKHSDFLLIIRVGCKWTEIRKVIASVSFRMLIVLLLPEHLALYLAFVFFSNQDVVG